MAVGDPTSKTGSLAPWAAPYVTGMLGKGQALANQGYQGYTGPLTAGQSAGQQAAFQGVAGLAIPTQQMGAFQPQQFTAQAAQDYMNPYVQAALDPQIEEARRQAQITRLADAGRLTQAGAYGGSRQAIMESELNRNLGQNVAAITGQGYQDAYTRSWYASPKPSVINKRLAKAKLPYQQAANLERFSITFICYLCN